MNGDPSIQCVVDENLHIVLTLIFILEQEHDLRNKLKCTVWVYVLVNSCLSFYWQMLGIKALSKCTIR